MNIMQYKCCSLKIKSDAVISLIKTKNLNSGNPLELA